MIQYDKVHATQEVRSVSIIKNTSLLNDPGMRLNVTQKLLQDPWLVFFFPQIEEQRLFVVLLPFVFLLKKPLHHAFRISNSSSDSDSLSGDSMNSAPVVCTSGLVGGTNGGQWEGCFSTSSNIRKFLFLRSSC